MKTTVMCWAVALWSTSIITLCPSSSPAQQKALLAESEALFPTCLACSVDGKSVAFGTHDGKVHVWTWKNPKSSVVYENPKAIPMCVQFSPNGESILIGGLDNSIRLIDVKKRAETMVFTGHQETVWAVAFRPDAKSIVSTSGDGTVRAWDCITGKQRYAVKLGSTGNCIAINSDGKLLACGTGDGKVMLFDANSGELTKELSGHSQRVVEVTFLDADKLLVSGGTEGICREWNVESGKEQRVLNTHSKIRGAGFSSNGKTITADVDGNVRMWDFASGKEMGSLLAEKTGIVVFGTDRNTFLTGGATIKVWNLALLLKK